MEYRSCIFTCGSDGCNHSNMMTGAMTLTLIIPTLVYLLTKKF